MVDLTNPVQTIVSILKNSSTGIGTTGYLITDDNASNLTITDGEVLVSFTMSKEELKAAFGGSQDYDVIITVKSGEIEDEWIGLSTKIWKVPIIITIHVIDKWSAVATKYITAPLVLYKAVNALRTFIKAKTSAPGGTINVWKATSFKNEEDITVKPTMYKCVVTTEAWMYYNPNPAGVGIITVTFNSERDDEADSNLGTITESSTVHDLPASAIKEYGARIQVTYTAGTGDEFDSWEVADLVIVEDSTANPTYMVVNGTGTLTAIYNLSCPSGEQVSNGDFEDDLTDWTSSGAAIDESNYHGGAKGVQINTEDGYILQTLGTETPVDCISASSVWLKNIGCPSADAKITITYTDDSTTIITVTGASDSWTEKDILGELTSGKTVKSIKIEMTNAAYLGVDDVTITC